MTGFNKLAMCCGETRPLLSVGARELPCGKGTLPILRQRDKAVLCSKGMNVLSTHTQQARDVVGVHQSPEATLPGLLRKGLSRRPTHRIVVGRVIPEHRVQLAGEYLRHSFKGFRRIVARSVP